MASYSHSLRSVAGCSPTGFLFGKGAGWRTNSGVVIVPPATQPPTRLQAFGGRISRASLEECRTRPQVRGRFQ